MSEPKVLVAVPTYGRPSYLPRLIASFKKINYNNKKLLIINDDNRVKYKLDKPDAEIDICNLDLHLNLSVKRNLFASWDWDIYMPLDDDDMFLPERINNHVRKYEAHPDIVCYRNEAAYYFGENRAYITDYTSFTNHSLKRQGWFESLGYTSFERSNFDDQSIHHNIVNRCECLIEADYLNLDFIYWWGNTDDETKYRNTFNSDIMKNETVELASQKDYIGKINKQGYITLKPDYDCYNKITDIIKRLNVYRRTEHNIHLNQTTASEKIKVNF
jgi:glycosyltransferase involved in cell wall biosynthesis|tara:strand:+ start:215 stop:1033 length:819 start_codon:yes stop_codon:yes gene_type:complete